MKKLSLKPFQPSVIDIEGNADRRRNRLIFVGLFVFLILLVVILWR